MKPNLRKPLARIGCLLLLTLLTLNARAYIVLQDSFNYPNGTLTNTTADIWTAGPGDASGSIGITNNTLIIPGNSGQDFPRSYFTSGIAGNVVGFTINAPVPAVPVYFFPSNAPVAALYYSLNLTAATLPTTSTYFAYLQDTNYDFRARLLVETNNATPGYFRLGLANNASSTTNILPVDLSVNTTYTVVARYVLSTGISTMWVTTSPATPAAETDSSSTEVVTGNGAIGLGGNTNTSTCGFGFRNAANEGTLEINNLVIGTAFGDVVPSSVGFNPPFVAVQPQDFPTAIVGDTVSFSTLAGGDTNLTYQWYYNTSTALVNQTNTTLTLTGVTLGSAGTYSCKISNTAGAITTRSAVLTVYAAAVAPSISAQPASQTDNVGDTATFTVTAAGVPPPGYQWYYVTNSAGTLKTNAIVGATAATYLINNISNNISGNAYYTTVTNRAGTNLTVKATLTVNSVQTVTIAALKQMVDANYNPTNQTSIYTVQGTVTTWTNTTTAGNTEFYMQDGTGGICVFWSGAPSSTNYPGAGSVVKVTAPMAVYATLVELEPVFTNAETSVKVISTGNPLPTPQALPFDPNVTAAQLYQLQSVYCVASNIYLAAGSTFSSGVNEYITNNNNLVLTDPLPGFTFTNAAGETFDIYVNAYTSIPGQAKPAGPVTMYGVLSVYNGGYEFTPTRYADIISYTHITNYLSNIVRAGDALTNTFSEGALPPGETWTTFASIGDAAGGSVTLTPLTAGLPPEATWSNITNGLTATAIFHFTPSTNDAGTNYVVSLQANSTSGTSSTYSWNVYVPTPDEQQMAITEFLVNPTTNTSSPLFNPLGRSSDTTGIAANDQYVEIANQSPDSYDLQGGYGWDIDNGSLTTLLENFDASADVYLQSSNAVVIYGGTGSAAATLPVSAVPASSGKLSLPTTGTGVIILRDGNGYIVDRVVYNASTLPTNSSLSRFPTINSPFVPQSYISTNVATAGLQYDGGSWGSPTKVPTGLTGISLSLTNKQAVIKFTPNTTQANTLWQGGSLTAPFSVVYGGKFAGPSGTFSVTNLPAAGQFFFITTQ
jgi:hypothetical protein